MARFEIELTLAMKNDDHELITVVHNIMCFCKNKNDIDEIENRSRNVISSYVDASENIVVFGSANIVVKNEEKEISLTLLFKNIDDFKNEEVNEILDLLLLNQETENTIH